MSKLCVEQLEPRTSPDVMPARQVIFAQALIASFQGKINIVQNDILAEAGRQVTLSGKLEPFPDTRPLVTGAMLSEIFAANRMNNSAAAKVVDATIGLGLAQAATDNADFVRFFRMTVTDLMLARNLINVAKGQLRAADQAGNQADAFLATQ